MLEQRIAWAVALCCMVLVALLAIKPAWFTVATSRQPPIAHPAHAPHPKQAVAHHHKIGRKAEKKATAAVRKKIPAVKSPVRITTKKAPAPTSEPTPEPTSEQVVRGYYAQLGAFHEQARAQGMADQLKHHGWHAVIATTQGGLHAVWVGPKAARSDAEALLKSIQRKINTKGFIVHHP